LLKDIIYITSYRHTHKSSSQTVLKVVQQRFCRVLRFKQPEQLTFPCW